MLSSLSFDRFWMDLYCLSAYRHRESEIEEF